MDIYIEFSLQDEGGLWCLMRRIWPTLTFADHGTPCSMFQLLVASQPQVSLVSFGIGGHCKPGRLYLCPQVRGTGSETALPSHNGHKNALRSHCPFMGLQYKCDDLEDELQVLK